VLARALYHMRRFLGLTYGLWAAALFALLLARRFFADLRMPGATVPSIVAVAALSGLLLGKLARRLKPVPVREGSHPVLADVELGLILLVSLFATLQLTGGARSPLHPLVYALVAFLVSFHTLPVGAGLVAATLTLEATLFFASPRGAEDRALAAAHGAFIGFFAVVNLVFLHAEVFRQRRAHEARIVSEIIRMREEARDFRVISSALSPESRTRTRAEEEEKLYQGAVENIHQGLYFLLEMLKKTLNLQTCIVLLLDDTGERLKIGELVTDSDMVTEKWLRPDQGALGAILRDRVVLNLQRPKHGHLPYYLGPEQVGAFLGVPILEDGHLRGVLCADRREELAFSDTDEQALVGATRQILRQINSERIFTAMEKSKWEHERFYRASEMLNRALTMDQVLDVAFKAAREITDFEVAAITLYDKERKRHAVAKVEGQVRGLDEQLSFGDNAGLAAMVIKNKHYLPAQGEYRDKESPVYTKRVKLRGMESLLVLPLICADEAIGTFMLAHRRRRAFSNDAREMLGVIGNQVAVAIENAKMYRRMEQMATTDGLTGLTNHRSFQERAAQIVERCARLGKKVSVILTDIDKFKNVNDTYGHPVGDQVIKRVAAVLGANVRKIDLVARYGGEEFCLVLEESDGEGARQLAERIRADMESQQFQTEKGPFKATLSLGVATFPADGRDKQALIDHADQALYAAKRSGRNRVVLYAELPRDGK
jgi:diguanylate cyclase (GGDEF)-like protein